MISFKDFLSEAKSNVPDGEVRYLPHRNVWVLYSGGKIIVTKKTEASAKAYAEKKGLTPSVGKAAEPKVAEPTKTETSDADDSTDDNEPVVMETQKHDIPIHNMEYLEAKIAKLNKTAAKLKIPGITIEKSEVFSKLIEKETKDMYGQVDRPAKYMDFITVTVHGEAPKLAGWNFVGKREPLEGGDSILAKSAPGNALPKKYQDDHELTCDHCKKRANRNATFVVKKGKKHMEVGRSCLKDFMGHANPEKYADFASALYDMESMMRGFSDEEYGGHGRGVYTFDTNSIVAAALHSIRDKGFVSTQYGSDTKTPTSYLINHHFNPPIPMPRGLNYNDHFKIHYTKEEEEEAKKVIDWMKNHPKAGKEEFWNNISKVAKSEASSLKMTGYLAAGVMMHEKEAGALKAKEGIMTSLVDEYAGTEGNKIDVMAKVISSFPYQSQGQWGGTKYIITAKTDAGHLIKMFSSTSGIKRDMRVNITGKVGTTAVEAYDSSPFKGKKITTMAPRSRVEELPTAEEVDKHFHVGDKVKFRREGKGDGIGIITAKPTYGRFEISPVSGKKGDALHVKHEDIINKV